MGDFGIKISKAGQDVMTSTLGNTLFSSDNPSLMLLEKKTIQWTAVQGDDNAFGTQTYTHNLGYSPLVLGFLNFETQAQTFGEFSLPYSVSSPTSGGTDLVVTVQPLIKDNEITMNWSAYEYDAGEPIGLTDDVDFTVVLHIYAYRLGYTT